MMIRILTCLILGAAPGYADPPEVLTVSREGTSVAVTLSHPDTGWDHYADGWRIESEDGTVLGVRDLLHPHVEEQPFTRSLGIADLPEGRLYVRARCSVDGWSGSRVIWQR